MSNRMIDACRSVLNRYIPDIYLYSDVYKGEESGKCVDLAWSHDFG
jgi:RNA 3'-terminal phosphate cyclase-like protein